MTTFELVEQTESDAPERSGRREYSRIEEDTVLEATVANVEVRPHPFFKDDNGEPQMKVNFEFNFTMDGQKRKLWGETNTTFTTHPDCKLRNWAQQILGGNELPAGFKLNTETLLNTPVRIVVGVEEWTDKKTGERRWKNIVKDVMYSKASPAPAFEDPF